MGLKRATLLISGYVQMAGFRSFVKNLADSLSIKGYAENLPDGRIKIVCEGEEENIEELASSIKTKQPALTKVEDVQTKYGEYVGEFLDFERRGEDVPKKATLEDLLKVMTSFDNKTEKMVGVLGEIKQDTAQIRQDTAQIPKIVENTEKILEHTSYIPAIKENTEKILEHTSHIPAIKENTEKILEHTSYIPAMREDTAEIKLNTREMVDRLWKKYEEMSKEIAEMKITLSKIAAKVKI